MDLNIYVIQDFNPGEQEPHKKINLLFIVDQIWVMCWLWKCYLMDIINIIVNVRIVDYQLAMTDGLNGRCLITALQLGLYKCLYCKYPFLGYDCKENDFNRFDERYTNPPKCNKIYLLRMLSFKLCRM